MDKPQIKQEFLRFFKKLFSYICRNRTNTTKITAYFIIQTEITLGYKGTLETGNNYERTTDTGRTILDRHPK